MKLSNHLVTRFLTDEKWMIDNIIDLANFFHNNDPTEDAILELADGLMDKGNFNVNYYVTESVLSKTDLIKIKRKPDKHYDWNPILSSIPDGKRTLIFPDNSFLRIVKNSDQDVLWMCHCKFIATPETNNYGTAGWDIFWVRKGRISENFDSDQILNIEDKVYRILCFMFLSEVTEQILFPQQKFGTKKQGKIINTLPFNITIVDKNWNITSVRTEGFGVSGHFAIRWSGKGYSTAKIVWIDPFKKNGYTRKAKINYNITQNI